MPVAKLGKRIGFKLRRQLWLEGSSPSGHILHYARMVELVYTIALEAIAEMHESSNLSTSIDNGICYM